MARHGNDKYKKKYAKQLKEGLRDNKFMTINAVCKLWGITKATYYSWIERHPDFKAAAEIGERDYHIQLEEIVIKNTTGELRGNAGSINLIATNVLGWNKEEKTDAPKAINKIEIEILQNKPALEQLEQEKVIESVKDIDYSNIEVYSEKEEDD